MSSQCSSLFFSQKRHFGECELRKIDASIPQNHVRTILRWEYFLLFLLHWIRRNGGSKHKKLHVIPYMLYIYIHVIHVALPLVLCATCLREKELKFTEAVPSCREGNVGNDQFCLCTKVEFE